MDKCESEKIFTQNNIPYPKTILSSIDDLKVNAPSKYPFIIKPEVRVQVLVYRS